MVDTNNILFILRLATFAVAAYLLYTLYCFSKDSKSRIFTSALSAMVIAVALFVSIEAMQVFGYIDSDTYDMFHLVVTFVFLVMLLYAMGQMKKDMAGLDHVIHRHSKHRMRDVE